MKTKLLILFLMSWDMNYIRRKDVIKNIYRIGEPKSLKLECTLPAITAKCLSLIYSGKVSATTFDDFWKLTGEDIQNKCIWNLYPKCSKLVLGLTTSKNSIRSNFNGVAFSTEAETSKNILIYPKELEWTLSSYKITKDYISRVIEPRRDSSVYSMGEYMHFYHNIYNIILNTYEYFDVTMIAYHTDYFTHKLRGPQLLEVYKECDRLLGETLDKIDTDKIIAISDHGANHRSEGMFVTNLNEDIDSSNQIYPLLSNAIRDVCNEK